MWVLTDEYPSCLRAWLSRAGIAQSNVSPTDGDRDGGTSSGQEPSHRRLEVLVVEDEAMVAMALERFLRAMGHRPTSCGNGKEALAVLKDRGFHAAVIDLGMPDMNGWEVTRQVNRLRPDIAVILASGRMVTADESRAMEVRVSAILTKPFGQDQLMAALNGAVGSGAVGSHRDR